MTQNIFSRTWSFVTKLMVQKPQPPPPKTDKKPSK